MARYLIKATVERIIEIEASDEATARELFDTADDQWSTPFLSVIDGAMELQDIVELQQCAFCLESFPVSTMKETGRDCFTCCPDHAARYQAICEAELAAAK